MAKRAVEQDPDYENPIELRKKEFRSRYKTNTDLIKLAKVMKAVQDTKERLEEELKMVNAEFDVLRLEIIPSAMENKGLENFTVEGLGRVGLTSDMYVKVASGAQPKLFAWLRKRKLGDLIQETVNSSTLKAFVKGRIETGKDIPKDLVKVTPFTRASITKG